MPDFDDLRRALRHVDSDLTHLSGPGWPVGASLYQVKIAGQRMQTLNTHDEKAIRRLMRRIEIAKSKED